MSLCLVSKTFTDSEIIGLILSQLENRIPLNPVLGGHGQCCTITLLHMNRLNKTRSAIFISLMCSLLPVDLHSEFISVMYFGVVKLNQTLTNL